MFAVPLVIAAAQVSLAEHDTGKILMIACNYASSTTVIAAGDT